MALLLLQEGETAWKLPRGQWWSAEKLWLFLRNGSWKFQHYNCECWGQPEESLIREWVTDEHLECVLSSDVESREKIWGEKAKQHGNAPIAKKNGAKCLTAREWEKGLGFTNENVLDGTVRKWSCSMKFWDGLVKVLGPEFVGLEMSVV